jgi:hypothetical protein
MNPLFAPALFDIGRELIQRLIPDKQEAAKAELELMKIDQQGAIQEMATRMSAITSEAQSEDPWTSRARPMFMYVFYVVILSLVIVAPLIGIFFPNQMELFFINVGAGFNAIPEELWWTFSAGYLGYAGMRTIEKRKK